MFSHMMVGSNDIDRSKKLYDALFGALGGKPLWWAQFYLCCFLRS